MIDERPHPFGVNWGLLAVAVGYAAVAAVAIAAIVAAAG